MNPRARPLPALLLALLAPYAGAQVPAAPSSPPPASAGSAELRYSGETLRAGIGYDSENRLRGDALWVFGEDARTAWIAELWLADRSAGGAQLSYHWRAQDAAPADGVRKAFAAFDQNRWRDRKLTLGGGYESERLSWSASASAGITGRRELSVTSATSVETLTGVDAGRPYEQDITTTTTTRLFERAYDWGVGGRIGHYHEGANVRVELGADYEWGRDSTSQATLTLGVEKFFDGSPISVGLVGDVYRKRGALEPDKDDARLMVMLRYSFGPAPFRPARETRMVQVEVPPPASAPASAPAVVPASPPSPPPAPSQPRVERRIVKTTATMNADAFFDFDRATLRPDAKAALDTAIERLRTAGYEGNIRITGHTCDIGTAAYNKRLSQRRADAVRQYLIDKGLPADRLLAEGIGEADPRYPNDATGRPKNRRVDIEFVTFEQKVEEVSVPPAPQAAVTPPPPPVAAPPKPSAPAPTVEWRREEIDTEPAWLRRALRNPAKHKQYVDVYRTQEQSTTRTEGERRYLNRPPAAQPDSYQVEADSADTMLNVLANDADPDNDALTIVAVTPPAHGTAAISGNRIAYRPAAGYTGSDTFNYTVGDGKGGTSSAQVTVAIVRSNRQPRAVDDFAVAGYNRPVSIDVLANDSDPDSDPLTVVSFTQPSHGTVTRGEGQRLVYVSAPNYIGYDAFTYTIGDGRGGTATATVGVFADP